ncbi:MAG: hypothetical protein D6690_02405 [Nitrospirae bacterium]|nr:MAG: hypothetical protein D6690_02405 [Nitrospirota bacterium]
MLLSFARFSNGARFKNKTCARTKDARENLLCALSQSLAVSTCFRSQRKPLTAICLQSRCLLKSDGLHRASLSESTWRSNIFHPADKHFLAIPRNDTLHLT